MTTTPAPQPKPSKLKKVLVALLMAASGFVVGGGAVKVFSLVPKGSADRPGALLLFALCLLAGFVAVLVHELGHALGGVAVGFRFLFLAVGPLWVERSSRGWRVQFNRVPSLWGGIAACIPSQAADLARRMAWVAAAGPLSSLLLAIIAGLGARLTTETSAATTAARFGLMELAVMSAMIFLATAVMPAPGGGFSNDGQRVWRLLKGDAQAQAESALLALTGLMMGAMRPRDWPLELVQRSLLLEGRALFSASARSMAALHALDQGNEALAQQHNEVMVALLPDLPAGLRPSFQVSAALVLARAGRVDDAERLVTGLKPSLLTEAHLLSLVWATIHAARGERSQAHARARQGLEEWTRPKVLATVQERELLEALTPDVPDRAALVTASGVG
jgi:hypothetical protein